MGKDLTEGSGSNLTNSIKVSLLENSVQLSTNTLSQYMAWILRSDVCMLVDSFVTVSAIYWLGSCPCIKREMLKWGANTLGPVLRNRPEFERQVFMINALISVKFHG